MEAPAYPADENVRLATLNSLNLLNTGPEERFDRYTRLAKQIFGVPIVLISLVDRHRQWFKSNIGLPVSETDRSISFCGHTILSSKPLVIPDTTSDHRFKDNPLVTAEPFIRFYAGYPLEVPNGCRLGTLCLIDNHPRIFNHNHINDLKTIAQLVQDEIGSYQDATLNEITKISNNKGVQILIQLLMDLHYQPELEVTIFFFQLEPSPTKNTTTCNHYPILEFSRLLLEACSTACVAGHIKEFTFMALFTGEQDITSLSSLSHLSFLTQQYNLKNPIMKVRYTYTTNYDVLANLPSLIQLFNNYEY
ncbi:GAF domain-containing protein [Spartinivicinus poritis]|uniref:GAF domain-containing protein n=1 Tax=Spartinivicinus poritis TaxID=2994640 RepID=A0ABT5UCL0_9GAMM|nr:GAF domain-containing protein [Spartinivicinus sp. A2-2]MDE1464057.1 GAF domain-containing protein [Spartinivicinus sp. A2-2]